MWGTRAQGIALAGLVAGASMIAGLTLAQEQQNPFDVECNRTATPEEVEGARGAHQAAKQFYDRAEYDRAIQYWRDVFRFDCNAVGTLINLANAYEKLGDRPNAIFALEAYIKRVKAGDPAADVTKFEAKIQNLKQLQQAQAAASASAAASANMAMPSATTPPPPPSATTPPVMVKPYGVAPWAVVGVGAAVAVVGGILIPVGYNKIKTAEKNCTETSAGNWSCPNNADVEAASSGKTLLPVGKVALGVGAAAVAGGLIWEFLANAPQPAPADKPETGRIRFSPVLGPGMSGATVYGKF